MGKLILDYYKELEPFADYHTEAAKEPGEYWYPIESGKEVLVFGTRDLRDICAKASHVTVVERSFFKAEVFRAVCGNADFLVGEITDIPIDEEYDYVTVENPKWYELRRLVSYLKPDGKLLICLETDQRETIRGLEITEARFVRVFYSFPTEQEGGCLYSAEELPTVEEFLHLFAPERQIVDEGEYRWARAVLEGNAISLFPATQFRIVAGRTEDRTPVPCRHIRIGQDQLVLPVDQDKELIEKVKEVQIDLLKALKTVCDDNGLSLFLIYGTLLGAERHQGFIPGDDDIDVALPREDYDRLLSLAGQFPEHMMLQAPQNDDCFYGGYIRLRDKRTTAIIPQNWWKNCCEGIFIDVFPLDYVSGNEAKEKRKRKKILFQQRLLYAKAYGYFDKFYDMPLLRWKFYKYLGIPIPKEKMTGRLRAAMAETDRTRSNGKMCIYAHYLGLGRTIQEYPAVWFEDPETAEFEGMEFCAPKDKKAFLTLRYGENYLQPTAWSIFKRRHAFYSVDEAYDVYKTLFSRLMKESIEGKRIILFGEKPLFAAFRKKYPDAAVTEQIELGKKKVPEAQADIYAVICYADVRKAEQMLKEAGYSDYRIFWANRDWLLRANVTSIREDIRNGC